MQKEIAIGTNMLHCSFQLLKTEGSAHQGSAPRPAVFGTFTAALQCSAALQAVLGTKGTLPPALGRSTTWHSTGAAHQGAALQNWTVGSRVHRGHPAVILFQLNALHRNKTVTPFHFRLPSGLPSVLQSYLNLKTLFNFLPSL